jgi:hypothetical protein
MALNLLSNKKEAQLKISRGGRIMKRTIREKDCLADVEEKADSPDSRGEITERSGEVNLLIVAIDPAIPLEIKSVVFNFQNRAEGLQAFNVLAATASNVHKTCVEDPRLYAKVRPQMHHL